MNYISQHEIEKYIDRHFGGKRGGYFLEVGAWDGEHISQTAWLERERGWAGLCVDPFPRNFEGRSCKVCAAAISADGKPREFVKVSIDRRDGGDVSYLSGFLDSIQVHWSLIEAHCDYVIFKIDTLTMGELCKRYYLPNHIDFLSVDTEGSELEIFQSLDLKRYSFGMIVFEHNGDKERRRAIGDILVGAGYRRVEDSPSYDDIFVSREIV